MLFVFNGFVAVHPLSRIRQLAPDEVPPVGTFYLFNDYLSNSNHMAPPYPMNPYFQNTNITVYDLGNRVYMVDNSSNITSDVQLQDALNALEQSQADLASTTMTMDAMTADATDTPTLDAPSVADSLFPTNGLWLSIETVSNNLSFLTLHGTAEGSQYEILSRENLMDSGWYSEAIISGATSQDWTPFTVPVGTRTNTLFFWARNLTLDSNGQGLPDWWQMQYFGHLGVDPWADSDGDGWNNFDEYQNGTDPNGFNVPPPPIITDVELDSTGDNIVFTWESGGGPVSAYGIEDQYFGYEVTQVASDVFTATIPVPEYSYFGPYDYVNGDVDWLDSEPSWKVRAYYTAPSRGNGPSSTLYVESLSGTVSKPTLSLTVQAIRGRGGKLFMAIASPPPNLSKLRFFWENYTTNGYEYPFEEVFMTNVVNGIVQLPTKEIPLVIDSSPPFLKAFSSNGAFSPYIRIPKYSAEELLFNARTNFVDARQHIAENLRFLFRAAGTTQTFRYSSGIYIDAFGRTNQSTPWINDGYEPEHYFARPSIPSDYEYYGFHTFSYTLNYSFIDEIRPVRENHLWRNYVFNWDDFTNGIFQTGAEQTWDHDYITDTYVWGRETNPSKYDYLGNGSEPLPPIAFTLASSPWLWFTPNNDGAGGEIGVTTGTSWTNAIVGNNVQNYYGLNLQSIYEGTNGPHYPGESFDLDGHTSVAFANYAAPNLRTVSHYFVSQTPYLNGTGGDSSTPALPGSPTFATTNTSPLLITGIGQPLTISGWAKMALYNGYPGAYGYLEQYFDSAYTTDTNGIATSTSAGVLSPYGEFLPTMPGAAALVTMTNLVDGSRGTDIVQVISLNVDADHDGMMDFSYTGPDQTTAARPFRFWINDSYDANDDIGDGIPEKRNIRNVWPNDFEDSVNGTRDLVNFFPVFINLRGLLQSQSSLTNLTVFLTQAEGALYGFETDLTPTNYLDFLTETNTATSLAYRHATRIQSHNEFGYGFKLSTNFLAKIRDQGEGIILIEASQATTAPLVLEIWQGTNLIAQTSVFLSISPIEKMFRQKNLIRETFSGSNAGWTNRLTDASVPNEPPTNDKNFVLVHGYNVNPDQARGSFSDIYKRLYWSGSHARFFGVTWYGSDSQGDVLAGLTANYHTNVYHAFQTASNLAKFLGTLTNGPTIVAGHSLGNMVVLSALSDWNARIDKYFMIDAAVPIEAIQGNVPQAFLAMTPSQWQPYYAIDYSHEWHSLFSDGRSGLTWADRVSNFHSTDVYNFYSSGEEVLRSTTDDPPTTLLPDRDAPVFVATLHLGKFSSDFYAVQCLGEEFHWIRYAVHLLLVSFPSKTLSAAAGRVEGIPGKRR